jgi:hypothetical protein
LDADQIATDQMYREMLGDPIYKDEMETYFIIDPATKAPIMIRQNLPGIYNQKYQNARNQALSIARSGRY